MIIKINNNSQFKLFVLLKNIYINGEITTKLLDLHMHSTCSDGILTPL